MRRVLLVGFFAAFVTMAWEHGFVLFAYTPARFGGLQRNPAQIGVLLSAAGLFGIFIMLAGFPVLQLRFGTLPLYRACMVLWVAVFASFVPTSLLARWTLGWDQQREGSTESGALWTGITLILACGRLGFMALPAQHITVKSAATDRGAMGATFGLWQTVASVAHTVGPAFVSSLYAFSVNRQILGGNLVWLVMCIIAASGYLLSRRL